MVWQVVVIYGDAQRCRRSAKFLPVEGQNPCKVIMRKRWGFIRNTSVCLTLKLSKGGQHSLMHGLCRSAVRKPSASGSFSHPPQIVLQRMNASAHPRAFWCENEVRWSVLLLGASENGRTIDWQKQLVSLKSCAKSGRHGSGRFAALCPSPPQRRKFLLSQSFRPVHYKALSSLIWRQMMRLNIWEGSAAFQFILRRPAGKF